MADELRPMFPGEQRTYTGELYLPVYEDPVVAVEVPRRSWASLVGALSGMLVATGFTLLQQRRPRVNNDDDLYGALGARVWTHVGRAGRRFAATRDQYVQVVTVAARDVGRGQRPAPRRDRHPRPDRAARGLAMGVAAALAGGGTPGGAGGRPVGPPAALAPPGRVPPCRPAGGGGGVGAGGVGGAPGQPLAPPHVGPAHRPRPRRAAAVRPGRPVVPTEGTGGPARRARPLRSRRDRGDAGPVACWGPSPPAACWRGATPWC